MTASRAYIVKRSGSAWDRKRSLRPVGNWVAPQYTAGSLPVGEASYTIPGSNVYYVATNGSDSNSGLTTALPLATLSAAIGKVAVAGTTIVVRGGTYHQGNIEVPSKPAFTIQNYPLEAVWFDGATTFAGAWTQAGSVWTAPYTITYDRNLGKGSGISTWSGPAWRTVVDQVWLDSTKLLPVADGTTPGAGQFSVNQSTDTLTIGSNPSGKTVRVSALNFMLAAQTHVSVKGIGIKRYAQAQMEWRSAALTVGAGSTVENCVIEHASLDALSFAGANCTVRRNTIQDTGHAGAMCDQTANGLFELNLIRRINRLQYDPEPTTAGFKVTRVFEGMTIQYNHIQDVFDGAGIWLDTTVSRTNIIGNTIVGTSAVSGGRMKNGIEVEGSDGGYYNGTQYYSYVVGNRVTDCRINALLIFDSGWVKVYNNSLSSAVALYLWQDYRQNDGSKPSTEGTIQQSPWHTRDIHVVNNALVPEPAYNNQLRAHVNSDSPFKIAGGSMLAAFRGNWCRPQGSGLFFYVGDAAGNMTTASTLTGMSNLSATYGGPLAPIMANNLQQDTTPPDSIADPLPAEVAVPYEVPVGIQKVGPIIPAPLLSM